MAVIVFTMGLGLVPFGAMVYFVFYGSDARVLKAQALLDRTMMRDERLESVGMQHRIFALFRRRILVAITSSRIITISRGLFGGFTMQDIQWKDLHDARIDQNVLPQYCGSNLRFGHSNKGVGAVGVDGVQDDVAAEIYSMAQSQEQAWEEKRRVRAMEEVRAAAGGVVVHTGSQELVPPRMAASQPSGGNRMLREIETAKKLLDMGAVSDAEYQEMKAKILSSA